MALNIIYFLSSGDWEVQHQGTGRSSVWWGPTCRVVDGTFLLCLHTMEGPRELFLITFYNERVKKMNEEWGRQEESMREKKEPCPTILQGYTTSSLKLTQVLLKALLFPAIHVTEWKLILWTWNPHLEVLLLKLCPLGFRGLIIIWEHQRARPGVTSFWIQAGVTVTLDKRRQAHQRETAQHLLILMAVSSCPAPLAQSLQNSVAPSLVVPSQPATLWRVQMWKLLQLAWQSRVLHALPYPPGLQN